MAPHCLGFLWSWNPNVGPFKWKLLMSTFWWYLMFALILKTVYFLAVLWYARLNHANILIAPKKTFDHKCRLVLPFAYRCRCRIRKLTVVFIICLCTFVNKDQTKHLLSPLLPLHSSPLIIWALLSFQFIWMAINGYLFADTYIELSTTKANFYLRSIVKVSIHCGTTSCSYLLVSYLDSQGTTGFRSSHTIQNKTFIYKG